MPKRSTKFYRKNEEEVMKALGLKPTKNSGATWLDKEDGQNEYLICQLKSTDHQSISVKQSDIRILEKNAIVSHKIPIFAIQFLNTGEVWLMSKPEDYTEVAKYIETGKCEKPQHGDIDITWFEELEPVEKKIITSNANAREEYNKKQNEKYDKTKSAI